MRTRIVPAVLLTACIGAFVASGLHSDAQGLQPVPGSVSEPETAVVHNTVVYCVTTAGAEGKPPIQKCATEPRENTGQVQITLRPAKTP